MNLIRHFDRLLARVLALLAALVVCGCSDDVSMPVPECASDGIVMSLRLSIGSVCGSRAVTEETGTDAENYIDLNDLKIFVFDENETLFDVLYDCGQTLSDKETQSVLEQLGPDTYILRSKLSAAYYNLSSRFAIVALANWRSLPADDKLSKDYAGLNGLKLDKSSIGTLKIDDLKKALFTLNPVVPEGTAQPDSWMPGDGKWIPFFGSLYGSLENYDINLFGPGNPMPLGDINLIRVFAKIEIINNDLSETAPEITGIELVNRNTMGRLVQDFVFTEPTGQVSAPSVPGDGGFTQKGIPFHQEGNVYTVYVPELSFENADELRKAIRVNIDLNGQKGVKWIYFAPYSSRGTPVIQSTYPSEWRNICRNNIYRFVINSLGFDFVISCERWVYGGKVHIQFEQF